MEQKIIEIVSRYGYFGIFGLITAENLFPPIPSEVILTAGGFLTTCTSMSVFGVTFFSTLGSVLGAIILYYIGRLLSQDKILKILQGPIGHILHFQVEDVLRAIEGFKAKGTKTVFFCRFIPIIRSLISIPAGMCKMDPLLFLLYTFTGSFGWNFTLIYLGSILGNHSDYFLTLFNTYSSIVKMLLVIGFCFLVYKKARKKHIKL